MQDKVNQDKSARDLESAVKSVLAFFDIFDTPLNVDEIINHLRFKNATRDDILEVLGQSPMIRTDGEYYFIAGRNYIVNFRKEARERADLYWHKINKHKKLFNFIPFAEAVFVCNTLAFNSPKKGSDIDLFVITKNGRIFTARTLMTLLFHAAGIRRHNDKVPGRFCLSFFINGNKLDLSGIMIKPEDVYLKYWLKTLIQVYGEPYMKKLSDANEALLSDFGSLPTDRLHDERVLAKAHFTRRLEKLLAGRTGNFIEMRLKNFHIKRHEKRKPMLGHDAHVIVSSDMLKYHNRDRRSDFYAKYLANLEKLSSCG